MHGTSLTIKSSVALVIAILSWCGVGFFISAILQMQSDHAAYIADTAAASVQENRAAQIRALARETAGDRASLDDFAKVDVITAAKFIESINASGTPVHVVSAQTVKTASKASNEQMNIVDLAVQAQGTFASLVRILRMLETLPLATTLQDVDLSRPPTDPAAKNAPVSWQLNAHIRFYTTTPLST